jgi:hypothetical protein
LFYWAPARLPSWPWCPAAPETLPVKKCWVPHISLVFREMWDSTALTPELLDTMGGLRASTVESTLTHQSSFYGGARTERCGYGAGAAGASWLTGFAFHSFWIDLIASAEFGTTLIRVWFFCFRKPWSIAA